MEKKKYFISADIEGCTDVTAWHECEVGGTGYGDACRQMSLEVAAACEAILEAGHEVVVRDGHGSAKNIIHSMLPRGTKLMRGWACHPGSMMAGLDNSYAGVLYIGYHAPAGSNGSQLSVLKQYPLVDFGLAEGFCHQSVQIDIAGLVQQRHFFLIKRKQFIAVGIDGADQFLNTGFPVKTSAGFVQQLGKAAAGDNGNVKQKQ